MLISGFDNFLLWRLLQNRYTAAVPTDACTAVCCRAGLATCHCSAETVRHWLLLRELSDAGWQRLTRWTRLRQCTLQCGQ